MGVLLGEGAYENTITIGSNSFITTTLHRNLPFSYRELTPIGIVGLHDFILWVRTDSPWQTTQEFITETRKRSITVGGVGYKLEDEIVFRLVEKAAATKPFNFMPMRPGPAVAEALADGEVEATVNQVNEIIEHYPERVRPVCVFRDESLDRLCRVHGMEAIFS